MKTTSRYNISLFSGIYMTRNWIRKARALMEKLCEPVNGGLAVKCRLCGCVLTGTNKMHLLSRVYNHFRLAPELENHPDYIKLRNIHYLEFVRT